MFVYDGISFGEEIFYKALLNDSAQFWVSIVQKCMPILLSNELSKRILDSGINHSGSLVKCNTVGANNITLTFRIEFLHSNWYSLFV